MGKLDKVWLAVPDDAAAEELFEAFGSYFGAAWSDALDAADQSFQYNAANDAYFAVRDLRPEETLTLEQLLQEQATGHLVNIVAS